MSPAATSNPLITEVTRNETPMVLPTSPFARSRRSSGIRAVTRVDSAIPRMLPAITPTMATPGGKVLMNESDSVALTKEANGTLTGHFTVNAQGFYKIEFEGPHAEKVNASPQYTIDVLSDIAPSVHFNKPGRDTTASPVEEVFAEIRADDDFGVKQLELFYSVNGGTEKTIHLLQERIAGHA